MRLKNHFLLILRLTIVILIALLLLGSSSLPPGDRLERVRVFTRDIEFDYIAWTVDAAWLKVEQFALGTSEYLPADTRHQIVLDYLGVVVLIRRTEAELNTIYADPAVEDPEAASAEVRARLDDLNRRRDLVQPVAEGILQSQIARVVSEMDLTLGGQPVPPVLYHATPLPYALIVSPRDIIRQDADVSLVPDLTLDEIVALEEKVDRNANVSSLVVNIGGVGVYPTMVYETSDLEWLSEVVSHEWVHNFLTLRPLGVNYLTTPQLRIMNETTANIAGKEIGRVVLEQFYPELIPPEPAPQPEAVTPAPEEPAEPVFDFRAEMHTTRVEVDRLLAEGKVEQAEAYMEERRVLLWNNGYLIRKLNQAYFAFHGAYADEPQGAAGQDPVGAAVRALRAQSPSLTAFLKRISWMTSFEQLQAAVNETAP